VCVGYKDLATLSPWVTGDVHKLQMGASTIQIQHVASKYVNTVHIADLPCWGHLLSKYWQMKQNPCPIFVPHGHVSSMYQLHTVPAVLDMMPVWYEHYVA
jgi:hypothetical protein